LIEISAYEQVVLSDFQLQDTTFEGVFWTIQVELDIDMNIKVVHENVKNKIMQNVYLGCQ
jgi:hypothetical protein